MWLIIIFFLIVGCKEKTLENFDKNRAIELENLNKKKAIELVQNYNPDDGSVKLIEFMALTIAIQKAAGDVIEIEGWVAEKTSDYIYRVTLSLIYNNVDRADYQFMVNIESGSIRPLNKYASAFFNKDNQISNSNGSDSKEEDWLIGTWRTSRKSETDFRLSIFPNKEARRYMLGIWIDATYNKYDNTLVVTKNDVNIQFGIDKKSKVISMASGEKLSKW